jgi:hypothetical protein
MQNGIAGIPNYASLKSLMVNGISYGGYTLLPKANFPCNFKLICPVQSYQQKDSTLPVGQIITTSSRRPAPLPEGRFAIVTKRWARDAMDASA